MKVILMICLNNRQREFRDAMERAGKSVFEILPDFKRDSFLVINHSNEREYKAATYKINRIIALLRLLGYQLKTEGQA